MDLLNVALQVIAIIAIIAVGAFIIVFLSDLLISIIDNHQGIFFRRGAGKSETYDNNHNYNYAPNNTKAPIQAGKNNGQVYDNFDFNDDFVPAKEEPKENVSSNPFKKKFVDLEAAAREQEMIEKAKSNFFDEEEEESEEEKAAKERMARLEERNKQLEEELKSKEQKLQEKPAPTKDAPKFDDMMSKLKEEVEEDDDLEEDSELEDYEALIKKINSEVKKDFQKDNTVKHSLFSSVKEEVEEESEEEELEEDFEDDFINHSIKQKETGNYLDLEKQIAELKAQLEEERKQAEQLKKEAEEKAAILLEEKQKFEQTIKEQSNIKVNAQDGSVNFASEEEYVARLEILEERLKEAKKELRKNKREFVPLNKIKRTLEKDQVKLRRKEAQVAKAKVALFGVNNSDIDPEKQAELEQEIDMLEGLKLSVQHCEDVMRENEDRYPILEQTHNILTKNVNNLTTDIELIEKKLKQLRAKK